jgi:hypothetical protein
MSDSAPPHSPVGSHNAQDDLQDLQPPARIPRTHVNAAVTNSFRALSLKAKLKVCKEIKDQNDACHERTRLNAMDPVNHPEPGSETALLFSLDDEDLEKLKRPSFAALFRDVMPSYIANWLFKDHFPGVTDLKRDSGDAEDSRIAKRRCMDGDNLQPRALDVSADLQFTQLLYETEDCGMIPLPLFLNDALNHISVNGANLPTFKANPKPGERKGFTIIDCKKLLARLDLAELTMTHAQWSEAAYNCFRFHSGRDIHGPTGSFALWWDKHFGFFNLQKDKVKYYDAWKSLELELRQEFYSQPTRYDGAYYAWKYDIMKNVFDAKSEFASMISSGSQSYSSVTSNPSSISFPKGSGKASPPASCVLCGEKGHLLAAHANDKSAPKLRNGRTPYAKYTNGALLNPDGKEICIKWNVRNNSLCEHGKERLHICSFCGASHNAFSWKCRSKHADL